MSKRRLSTIDGIRRAFPSFSGQQPNCSRSEEDGGYYDYKAIIFSHSQTWTSTIPMLQVLITQIPMVQPLAAMIRPPFRQPHLQNTKREPPDRADAVVSWL